MVSVGFLSAEQFARHGAALDRIIAIILDQLQRIKQFDFADRSFVEQIRHQAETIAADRDAWHIPPAHTLFVQRKISGTAMLAVRMKAHLPLRDMVANALAAGAAAPSD